MKVEDIEYIIFEMKMINDDKHFRSWYYVNFEGIEFFEEEGVYGVFTYGDKYFSIANYIAFVDELDGIIPISWWMNGIEIFHFGGDYIEVVLHL